MKVEIKDWKIFFIHTVSLHGLKVVKEVVLVKGQAQHICSIYST